jgi:hypothetical protein
MLIVNRAPIVKVTTDQFVSAAPDTWEILSLVAERVNVSITP